MKGIIICRGYGYDESVRRFWSGRRRLRAANTTDRDIVGVHNYGYADEQTITPLGVA